MPAERHVLVRNRDLRLLWTGQTLSELGTGLSQLAYPLMMLRVTGSPAQAGALGAVRAVPFLLLGLPAGALADRWDRRRVMVSCELVRAVTMASLPIALIVGGLTAAQLYLAGFIGGAGYVLFSAAEAGAVPAIVEGADRTAAVSAQEVASSGAGVLAPPLGGVLFGLMSGLPFAVDALSYLVSATATARVRLVRPQPVDEPEKPSLRNDIAEGVRWLWRHRGLRAIGLLAAGMQVAISGVGLVVIITARRDHASTAQLGLVLSTIGVGGILGGVVAPRLERRLGLRRLLLGVAWLQGLLWLVFAFAPDLLTTAVALLLFAATMPLFGIAVLSYQMSETPDELRGRVSTTFGLLIWGATPIGAAVAGLLLESYSTERTSLCFAGWVAVLGAVATSSRGVKDRSATAAAEPRATVGFGAGCAGRASDRSA